MVAQTITDVKYGLRRISDGYYRQLSGKFSPHVNDDTDFRTEKEYWDKNDLNHQYEVVSITTTTVTIITVVN